MITNAPAHVFIAESALPSGEVRPGGYVDRFLAWVQQLLCALHGHDALLQFERNRIFLRCTSCGHETPGWEVAPNGSTLRHRPEARPVPTARADLAVARKVA